MHTTTLSPTRRRLLGAAGAAPALGFPAIVKAQTTLNVGVLLPTSGVLALIGQSCKRGVDIASSVLADMGYGQNMKVMFADTESSVDAARARAEKLINEGANILVGPFDSGAAAAIAQVAEQKGVPFVINIAAAPQITEQGYKFTFRNFPTSVDLVRNGLGLMRDLFQATSTAPRTAVFMHINDTFGQANKTAIDRILPTLNYLPFKVVDTISYDREARDLSVEVAKAKATNADFIMLVSRLNDAILLRREMVKQRWNPMGIISPGSPGMYEEQFFKVLGKLSDHCISNVPWFDPKSAVFKRVETAFKKAYPQDNIAYHALNAGYTFEAMMVAADAFKRAKSTDGKVLAEAIRQTNIAERMMLGQALRFNAKGQVEGLASACVQNFGGKPTVVLPTASAEAKPVFPWPKA
jgi:branched-chain amino acid transport system substrate-binding protein